MSESNLEGIAIIGLTGRFPGAANVDEFWRNLINGVESISNFSDAELEESGFDAAALRKNPNFIAARGVLEKAEFFDAPFFGMNPKEAEVTDPQQRLFLEASWEALENAGYSPAQFQGSIGVYAGMGNNTYYLNNLHSRPDLVAMAGSMATMMANEKDFLATRVAYKLNLKGPALNINTACSTSLVAVCQACQALLNYQCDIALAGAISVSFPQKHGLYFEEGGIVSPDGHCRAFDARAQGTVSSDGLGIVVLKRVAEAVKDGDEIYAVIKGSALNNDGSGKVSFASPSVEGQTEVIAMAQAQAGISPETISYVETHGTGTPLGDPIEIEGLKQAFGAAEKRNFCAIGSVKTNIGHLDTAAGVAGLIKTALALKHQQIPASLHFTQPNPRINFANSPFFVNTALAKWPEGPTPRRAGVSSFGLGGTNSHVVLEEAPPRKASLPSRAKQLLVFSARTATALDAATKNFANHLKANPDLNFADAAYTLQIGRTPFNHRRSVVCSDAANATAQLEATNSKRVVTRVQEVSAPPVVFMFPGQGAQYINMGAELYRTERVFADEVDRCAKLLQPHIGLDLRQAIFPQPGQEKAAEEVLIQTRVTQPALFVIEYALARLWMSWGVKPTAMIGHSVGEYVAGCLAGVFSLETALELVAQRARLVQMQPGGAMLAVRLPEAQIHPLLQDGLSLAAVNSVNLCVVSGPYESIERLEKQLSERGIAGRRLQTSHAFHSAMMEPVLGPFTELLRKVELREPTTPYVSNVTAKWITSTEATDPNYWAGHVRQTVRFAEGVGELLKEPHTVLLEVGPGQTLSTLTRQHPSHRETHSVISSLGASKDPQAETGAMLDALGKVWLAGITVDWAGLHQYEHRHRIPLPTYPFERKRYWAEPGVRPSSLAPCEGQAGREPESRASISSAWWNGSRCEPGVAARHVPPGVAARHMPAPSPPLRGREGDTPSEVLINEVAEPLTRKERILNGMVRQLAELSGKNASEISVSRSFMELGFDSLFLAQASQVFFRTYRVKVTFRQLLEHLNTLNDLAAHFDREMPPEAIASATLQGHHSGNQTLPSPSPRTSPLGRGSNDASHHFNSHPGLAGPEAGVIIQEATDTAGAAKRFPSPWGEGQGEGDSDIRQPIVSRNTGQLAHQVQTKEEVGAHAKLQSISSKSEPITIPLSEAQSEVWLATQQGENASRAFNQVFTLRFRGHLLMDALQQSLDALVARHDALRTTFLADGSGQSVAATGRMELQFTDISDTATKISHDETPSLPRSGGEEGGTCRAATPGGTCRAATPGGTCRAATPGGTCRAATPGGTCRAATPGSQREPVHQAELMKSPLSGSMASQARHQSVSPDKLNASRYVVPARPSRGEREEGRSRPISTCTREQHLAEITRAEDATTFDLVNGPLIRAKLVKCADQDHILLVATHHLVMDGWSIAVFCRELSQFYNAFVHGEKPSLKPVAQLRDYLQWQAAPENRAVSAQAESWWLAQYASPPAPVELPTDRMRSATPGWRAACESLALKPALHQALKEIAAQQGVTLFTLLFASLNVLLSRLSGNNDVALGVPAAGQLGLGTDEGRLLIGHCVNFLPLRSHCDGALSFGEHLQSAKRLMLDAYEHQQFTYGNLVQKLKLPRDASRPPLLCASFNVMRSPTDIQFDGLDAAFALAPKGFNLFDLGVDVVDSENELRLDCRFNSDLFEPATFRRWLNHWQTLLEAAVRLPELPIAKLPLLDDSERKKIVMEWNDTHRDFPPVQSMVELFETQARENPVATALIFHDQRLSYRELNQRANRLARHLRRHGVERETLVAICAERSPEMIVGLLAILKAGGAYVPLDPHYPADRLAFILQDTKATVLLTQQQLAPALPPHHAQLVFLDAPVPEIDGTNPASEIQPYQLAYIIYTSGSTGRPKGVAIEHRNALALIHWAREVFTKEELSGVLASTSICFDLSVFEIFVTLSSGGKIVLAENALELPRLSAANEVTLINTVPSAAAELVRQDAIPASVVTVNLAGEPLKCALVQQLYQRPHIKKVYDLYGPSEDTTYSTWTLRLADGPETIGRPMTNKQVYLLDGQLQPVPVGVTGELYIGGAGVTRGYLNRPELTAEKFIPDPFSPRPGARLYKTGDLARYFPDGNIQFLGRIDHQVKVRGFRIELGEIESVLRRHENIRDVIVVARDDEQGVKSIVAYLVAKNAPAPSVADLKEHISSLLPEYMVPSAFVVMDNLPLTPNGKVDRKALPEPDPQGETSGFVPPVTEAEMTVAKMWREVLGIQQVGLHDDFFSLGGHSLMATQLISRFSKFHHVRLSLRDIFDAPTVAEMSKWLEQGNAKGK